MRLYWRAWTTFVHRAAGYQSHVLLNVLYIAVFGPSVLLARAFRARLLDLDTRPRASYWNVRQPLRATVDDLARHF